MGLSRTTLMLVLGTLVMHGETPDSALDKDKQRTEIPGATVTVTAEATAVEVARTPNPVKVFTAETMERQGGRTLPEFLRMALPGQVSQSGGAGTLSQLYLGGTRPVDTVVTLDGLRMQDSMSIGTNLSQLSLIGIDRLEIQQGPCSTLHGSDAMGGVMAFYTMAPEGMGYSGQATVGMGTNQERLARVRQAFRTDRTWVRLDGETSQENPSLPSQNPYRHVGTSVAAGLELWDGGTLRLGHRTFFVGSPLPVAWVSTTFRSHDPKREGSAWNQQSRANLSVDLGGNTALEVAVGHGSQTRMEPKYGGGQSGTETTLDQGKVTLSSSLQPVSYRVLMDAFRERGSGAVSNNQTWANVDTWGEKRSLALATEVAFEPEQSPLRIVVSARDEETTQSMRISNAQDNDTVDSRAFTWKAGATLSLSEGSRVYASTGSGFSTPLLYQVLSNAVNRGDVLENEQSRFIQVGFSRYHGPWHVKVDAQSVHFEHLVYFDLDPAIYRYRNGQDMRFRTLEAEVGYGARTWNLDGFIRSQEARRLGVPEARQLTDGAVIRRPFLVGGLRGALTAGAFRAEATWSWSGDRYESFGDGIRPGHVHFNDVGMALSYVPTPKLTLHLRGRNLLQTKVSLEDWQAGRTDFRNDAYQVYNYPAAPPQWSLEAKLRW